MKLFLLFLPFLFISQDPWQAFSSPVGRFEIQVPGAFTEKSDTVATEVGKLVYKTYFIQLEEGADDNLFYMVSYCDYPESIVISDSTEMVQEFFESTIETAAASVKGEVSYSADVKLDKFPGKQWRIAYLGGKAVIKTKAYLVKNRYYALQTIAWKEKSLNASSNRFFDSFKLLP